MTKQDLIRMLMIEQEFAREDSRHVVNTVFDILINNLCERREIKISGFGTFMVGMSERPSGKSRMEVLFKPSIETARSFVHHAKIARKEARKAAQNQASVHVHTMHATEISAVE